MIWPYAEPSYVPVCTYAATTGLLLVRRSLADGDLARRLFASGTISLRKSSAGTLRAAAHYCAPSAVFVRRGGTPTSLCGALWRCIRVCASKVTRAGTSLLCPLDGGGFSAACSSSLILEYRVNAPGAAAYSAVVSP